jgi:hypothetical protein
MANEPDSVLTGAAFELANAGYTPMPDPAGNDDDNAIGSDSASLREAAEQRGNSRDDVIVREYLDGDGKPIALNEAVTLERAARDYAGATSLDKFTAENQSAKALAARVDALRAAALAEDPAAAEFYGFEPPQANAHKTETETGKNTSAQAASEVGTSEPPNPGPDHAVEGLDPELAKALQHPQVVQAIEQRIGEAEKTRQNYLDGLAAATQIAQISFLSQFPELANIAPQNMPATLEAMSRQDPQKFARVRAMVATSEQLFAQQQHESRRQAESARQNFDAFAKSEDARLETMLKSEPKATQHAVTAEIFASAKASGIEPAELFRLFNSEPLMRNAVFQRMMYDAGKYRLAMKAREVAATRPIPPVQRPGMARAPGEREHADLRTLNARLSNSGDIKDAVALYNARKSSKR